MKKTLPSITTTAPSSTSSAKKRPSTASSTSSSLSSLPSPSTSSLSSSSSSPSIRLPPHALKPTSSSNSSSSTRSTSQKSRKNSKVSEELTLPPIYHQPILLLENYKIFWRIHLTALISIYYHLDCEFFEVIPYLVDKAHEASRLYVSYKSIVPILENSSEMRMVKLLRWDLLDRSMRKCAAEYIFTILDSDSDGVMHLTKFDVRENILSDLHVPQPSNLIPVVVERNPIISTTAMLNEITELSHDIPTITETATELVVSAESQLNTLTTFERHYKTETSINPNIHSPARWKWIWGIDKVLLALRVQKVIHAIWKRANKGRLVYQTMTLEDQKGMLTNGRSPLFHSFRRFSTTISARLPESSHPTPAHIQPPVSVFQELISSFEESKENAKERRKSKILPPFNSSLG